MPMHEDCVMLSTSALVSTSSAHVMLSGGAAVTDAAPESKHVVEVRCASTTLLAPITESALRSGVYPEPSRGAQHDVPMLAFMLTFFLVACTGGEPQPSPSDIFGPSTATGTIVGTGASLYRRGTHVLLMSGRPRFYLESKQVNLQEFEGDAVVVQGEITSNTHPSFLPVIEVESVTVTQEEADTPIQKYDIPFLALSLEAPRTWLSTLTRDRLVFRREEGKAPFIEVEKRVAGAFPEGLSIRIGGRNGVRVIEEGSGKHLVYVEGNADAVILFTFTPEVEDPLTLRDAFYALLRTVMFAEEASSSAATEGRSSSSSSSSGPFIPCGGPAHVLCPAGMYCEVREFDTGIGACRQL